MNEVAAYGGFPTRYPHWRWGMEYEQLSKKTGDYGLSKIYEAGDQQRPLGGLPARGQLAGRPEAGDGHVSGHNDFFKNNFTFKITDQDRRPLAPRRGGPGGLLQDRVPTRKWVDTFANHAARVRAIWTGTA